MYKFSKRLFDIFMSFFGIIFLSPILLFIAVSVKFTSEGTILYRGERSGLFGKSFNILKFRTMVMNADLGAGTTSRNDKRITYVGNILRRYKLDELPQLINVFFGDMSFVGPRPELQKYTNQYQGEEKLILSVRPGITDFASIVFSDEGEILKDSVDPDLDYNQLIRPWKSRLGLLYIDKRNLLMDIRLILFTAIAIFSKKKSLTLVNKLLFKYKCDEKILLVSKREKPLTPFSPPGLNEIVSSRN